MIELIFALVIMGIVLMSAPMLIQQSIRSGNVAMQQEAVVAAASQASIILSMHWDENNNSNSAVSPMLDVNRDPFDFNDTDVPVGLNNGVTGRSNINPSGNKLPATLASNFGRDETNNVDTNESDFTDFDDVDDYHGSEFNLTVFNSEFTTADVGDYVDTSIIMNTNINYTEDRVSTGTTTELSLSGTTLNLNNNINSTPLGSQSNIKFIRVNLISKKARDEDISELDKNITFEAFSCNIGTSLPQGANH